jgi:hypothetical protein
MRHAVAAIKRCHGLRDASDLQLVGVEICLGYE